MYNELRAQLQQDRTVLCRTEADFAPCSISPLPLYIQIQQRFVNPRNQPQLQRTVECRVEADFAPCSISPLWLCYSSLVSCINARMQAAVLERTMPCRKIEGKEADLAPCSIGFDESMAVGVSERHPHHFTSFHAFGELGHGTGAAICATTRP